MRWILLASGLLGLTGVALGAFAAHGLEGWLQGQGLDSEAVNKRLHQCDVAVRYQMVHALALLALASLANPLSRAGRMAASFWILGVVLFCGGLYSMIFLGIVGHWAIVPSGGLSMILGWAAVLCMGLGSEREAV